jgi:hypothetical protein
VETWTQKAKQFRIWAIMRRRGELDANSHHESLKNLHDNTPGASSTQKDDSELGDGSAAPTSKDFTFSSKFA